jgi:hypothetical protein
MSPERSETGVDGASNEPPGALDFCLPETLFYIIFFNFDFPNPLESNRA